MLKLCRAVPWRRWVLFGGAFFAACGAPPDFRPPAGGAEWLVDDFELGLGPLAPWTGNDTAAGVSMGPAAEAAHRGMSGLRVVDAHSAAGSGDEASLSFDLPPGSPDCHLRMWTRVGGVSGAGAVLQATLEAAERVSTSGVFDLGLTLPGPQWTARGYDGPEAYRVDGSASASGGAWHLVELALEGAGTANGTRTLWLDGVRAVTAARDFTGVALERVRLGEPWADELSVQATFDYDDVRIGPRRHASTLSMTPDLPWHVGACQSATVFLRDSEGEPAGAPYEVVAEIAWESGAGGVYSDEACRRPLTEVALTPERGWADVFVRPTSVGRGALVLTHPDFVSGRAAVDVSGEPSQSLRGWGCSTSGSATLALPALGFFALLHRRRGRP